MARKTIRYTVPDEGRDKGKVFVLTELPASKAEAWAMQALLALMNNNSDIPEGFEKSGMAGMAEVGLRALSNLKWEVAEPLLNQMWECVQIIPDPSKPNVVRPLIEEDIEEIMTRIKLRAEIFNLHVDFLKAVAPLISGISKPTASKEDTQNTKTSLQ